MRYTGPPGMMLDLVQPSPGGVNVEYIHPYTDANLYTYAVNNPTSFVDPSGLFLGFKCTPWIKTYRPCTPADDLACFTSCKLQGKGGGRMTKCYTFSRTCFFLSRPLFGQSSSGGDCLCCPQPPANKQQLGCPNPCPPPTVQIDLVPPSRKHGNCPGHHWHFVEYNQTPPPACLCIPKRRFGGCL